MTKRKAIPCQEGLQHKATIAAVFCYYAYGMYLIVIILVYHAPAFLKLKTPSKVPIAHPYAGIPDQNMYLKGKVVSCIYDISIVLLSIVKIPK